MDYFLMLTGIVSTAAVVFIFTRPDWMDFDGTNKTRRKKRRNLSLTVLELARYRRIN